MSSNPEVAELYSKVTAQGNAVRKLKSEKASKEDIAVAVKVRQRNAYKIVVVYLFENMDNIKSPSLL